MVLSALVRSLPGRLRPVALALPLVLAAACGGGGDGPPATPTGVEALSAGTALAGTVGTELAAPVRVRVVGDGARPVRGATVSWTAEGGGTPTPAASVTDGDGVAQTSWRLGGGAGTQQLTASVGGAVSRTLSATATAGRAASVRVQGDSSLGLVPGVTVQLAATVVDRFGNVLAAAPITWSSPDGTIATIDASGRLITRAPGTVVIVATSDTARARLTVRVATVSSMTVSRVGPDTLVPGGALTIDGTNFVEGGSTLRVLIGGLAATVVEATPTRIRATVPGVGTLPCQGAGAVAVTVLRQVGTGALDSVRALAPLQGTAVRRALRVGESVSLLTAADARCTLLDGGGRYVVSLFNTDESGDRFTFAQLRGMPATTLAADRAPLLASRAAVAATPSARAIAAPTRAQRQALDREQAHGARVGAERELVRRVGSPLAALRAERARGTRGGPRLLARARRPLADRGGLAPSAAPSSQATPVAALAEGDTVAMGVYRYPQTNCAVAQATVRARVVYVGRRAVLYEDVANAQAGRIDAVYRQVGQEVDELVLPMLERNFGNPLALDAQLDRDGKIAMLFTRQVNDSMPGILGFITSCNFFARSTPGFQASNEMELFYALAPSATDVAGTEWRYQLRSTVAHELKHLTAYAEKIQRAAGGVPNYEEIWLEEGSARLAEEIFARNFSGARWRGNAGYAATVGCERTRCDDRPRSMAKHWEILHSFYALADSLTPLGHARDFRATFYASGWSLLRWALDHYGGTDEAPFLRALTLEPTLTGLANLASRTGRPPGEMLADWGLSLYVDDAPGLTPLRPQLTQPSWNTRDMLRGLNASSPPLYPGAFPLAVRPVTYGSFLSGGLMLRGFGTTLFELSGTPAAPQLLELGGDGGTPLPPTVRMAIVRVE